MLLFSKLNDKLHVVQEDAMVHQVLHDQYQQIFFTLFFHLTTRFPLLLRSLISLTYTFFTTLHPFFLKIPNHLKEYFSTIPLHLHKVSFHIFHTCFYCSHPSIMLRHMLLSDNSFPQFILLHFFIIRRSYF